MPCRPGASLPLNTRRSPLAGGADVSVEGLTWRPARRRAAVFRDLDLFVPAGQRVLVAGPSGAGKSSLLRAIAGVLLTASHGDLSGRVRLGGRGEAASTPDGNRPGRVGMLLQDPSTSIVASTVGRDVAFGLENMQVPRDQIWSRVEQALRETGFEYPLDHPTAALSGGEMQRLALAGSLAMHNEVTLLDEPTSMLDEAGAQRVRQAVQRDVENRGSTLIVVEHRLEPWLDFADRLVVLNREGAIAADGVPRAVLRDHGQALAAQGVWVPGIGTPASPRPPGHLVTPHVRYSGDLVSANRVGVEFRTRRQGARRSASTTSALAAISTTVSAGQALAVTGASGAGKSTLVSVLAGLLRPSSGEVLAAQQLAAGSERRPWRWSSRDLAERISWVPQTPEHGVVAATVDAELAAAGAACRREPQELQHRADGLLASLGLAHLRDASPYHLSGGEQRRLMVAAALVHGPAGVLLDEPTLGQDRLTWAAVMGVLAASREAGTALAFASHDHLAIPALADAELRLERRADTS
ncbi:MAG TPA: ATP-binding cassette domain-containing protein [Nocardioidaceae bacterium]|nr:ATP-binding cassette domain-containing protein [Nocardioidaceae bacterium]